MPETLQRHIVKACSIWQIRLKSISGRRREALHQGRGCFPQVVDAYVGYKGILQVVNLRNACARVGKEATDLQVDVKLM